MPGHPQKGRLHLEHGAVITQPHHGWVTGHSAGLDAAPAPVLPPHDHIHDLVPSVEPVRVADQPDPARGRPDQGTRAQPEVLPAHVRDVVRSFFPVVAGRGVVQLSAYIDNVIASWLPSGAVAALAYAQTLYTLPISLFGMSISAASLPSMSAAQGTREALHKQLSSGLRAIAFPVVPTVIAFLAFGDVAVAALFRSGRFSADDVRYVWMILAGSTVGLLAATQARLYSSTFYALRDSRTPLKYAAIRVALTAGLGVAAGLWLPRAFHLDSRLGAVGLTASAGVAGWIEYALLRRGISVRVGPAALPGGLLARLWGAAIIAGAIGLGVKFALAGLGASRLAALVRAAAVFGAFGVSYLLGCLLLEVPEAAGSLQRVRRLLKR